MRSQNNRKRLGRRGSTLVEMAVCFPPAFLVLLAGLDIGQFMMRQQGFVERVRFGCRYAVVEVYDEAKIRNVVVFGTPDPVNPAGRGLYGLEAGMVSISRADVGDEAAERITVEISNYPLFLFTPGLAGQYTARPVKQSITRESLGG